MGEQREREKKGGEQKFNKSREILLAGNRASAMAVVPHAPAFIVNPNERGGGM